MFDNAGAKIQTIAKVFFWLDIAGFIILAIVFFSQASHAYSYEAGTYRIYGILFLIVGPIVSYIQALFVYGFGELIENMPESYVVHRIADTLDHLDPNKKQFNKIRAEEKELSTEETIKGKNNDYSVY